MASMTDAANIGSNFAGAGGTAMSSWFPLAGAALQAGSSIFGGMLGASGQQGTNAQSIAAAQQAAQFEANFNAQQGDIQRDFNATMQRDAFGFNAAEAQKNREFQTNQAATQMGFQQGMFDQARVYNTEMANTAWQRGVADMRAAGINPILAASLGGASSPTMSPMGGAAGGGAQASGSAATSGSPSISAKMPQLGNAAAALQHGVMSAGQAASTMGSLALMQAQAKKDMSQTGLNEASTGVAKANEEYQKSNTVLNRAFQDKARQDTTTSATQAAANKAIEASNYAAAGEAGARTQNHAAQNAIIKIEAATAYERWRIAQREAQDRETSGGGYFGDAAAAGKRILENSADYMLDSWNRHGGFGSLGGPGYSQKRSLRYGDKAPTSDIPLEINIGR